MQGNYLKIQNIIKWRTRLLYLFFVLGLSSTRCYFHSDGAPAEQCRSATQLLPEHLRLHSCRIHACAARLWFDPAKESPNHNRQSNSHRGQSQTTVQLIATAQCSSFHEGIPLHTDTRQSRAKSQCCILQVYIFFRN